MSRLTEERFRLESKVETSLINQDVRRVDLNTECASSIWMFLIVHSQVELEVVLVGKNQFILDR